MVTTPHFEINLIEKKIERERKLIYLEFGESRLLMASKTRGKEGERGKGGINTERLSSWGAMIKNGGNQFFPTGKRFNVRGGKGKVKKNPFIPGKGAGHGRRGLV